MISENQWVSIIPGKYEININSCIRSVSRIDSMGRKQGGFIIKQTIGREGYYRVALRISDKQTTHFVHRLLSIAFIPNHDNKPCINHINSNRLDNSLSNLEWVTTSENNSHAHRFGGQSKYYGEKHHQSKLTWALVNEIRDKYIKGVYTLKQISKDYTISVGSIYALLTHKTWKNEYFK